MFERFKALGYGFVQACHPSAIIAPDVTFQEGTQVMASAIIQPSAAIGANAIINTGAEVNHHSRIGAGGRGDQ